VCWKFHPNLTVFQIPVVCLKKHCLDFLRLFEFQLVVWFAEFAVVEEEPPRKDYLLLSLPVLLHETQLSSQSLFF
jgi:hypothetical protein